MKIVWLFIFFITASLGIAAPTNLDQLLQQVKQAQSQESRINQEREAFFLSQKSERQRLLKEAQAKLLKAETKSRQLTVGLKANEGVLTKLESELKDKAGVFGELFGVVRQVAGDTKAVIENSLISGQFKGRTASLKEIADSKEIPTIKQLEGLWYTLQQEMTESGKVVRFPAKVILSSGDSKQADVVRIGSFNLVSGDEYLKFLPETEEMVVLPRQPASRYTGLLDNLDRSGEGYAEVAIDPSQGVLLSLLVQAPSILERINQGGTIGYIIIALGIIGLAIVIMRMSILFTVGGKMSNQMDDLSQIDKDNPLGRVLAVAQENPTNDIETLELLVDEAITKEAPKLEKGLSLIKLLAAVAPLLGLLGTVTGMIETFQSISLFGTGDPKLMAGGISQALVTTMLGLIVAIPMLFLHSILATRSKELVQILDEQSAGLVSRTVEKIRQ
ncbi:MAG: MotA/TolQ/ExbB proton channel family protein [Methylococcales bacterium]